MEKISKGYLETYTILNLLSKKMKDKIPTNVFKRIEENKNKEIANINIENLEKYKISDEANQILAVIYKKYFASEKEKQIIKAKERLVFEKRQEELRKKYSVDNLWKSKKRINNVDEKITKDKESVNLIKYEESFIRKMIDKVKTFFCRTK